jgi:thymidylate synthase ThyX
MKLIKPSYEIISKVDTDYLMQLIEQAGRTCYKSEDKITTDSSKEFIKMLLNRHHESVIEHGSMTVRFIVDRGVSHELVRHRLASFSQESTRYVSSIDRKSFSVENENDIIDNYLSGKTMKRISDLSQEKYTEWEVYKILDNNNIERRNHNRKGILNEGYFSIIDSSLKAYLIGFIQADGSIRSDLNGFSISQNAKFSWFLENLIQKEIYTKIHRSPDRNNHSLCVYSKSLVSDLILKGIVVDKSHKQTEIDIDVLWKSIPTEYIQDFVRGVLDGDGWVRIFIQNEKTESCNIGWSGNEFLMNKISQWIENEFQYKMNVSLVAGTDKTYRISITKPSKAREITNRLYKNFVFPYGHPAKTSKIYNFNKFDYKIETIGDVKFNIILPPWLKDLNVGSWIWLESMYKSEESYRELMSLGWKPEQARSVLPNSLKTEIVVTANFREWRTIFKQRTAPAAHPQMREVMIPLLNEVKSKLPILFDDILT